MSTPERSVYPSALPAVDALSRRAPAAAAPQQLASQAPDRAQQAKGPHSPIGVVAVTRLLPPLLAFALVRIALALSARASGFKPTIAVTYSRWDSAHYLAIAERGYELFSCSLLPGFNPHEICGNTAWLPAYPALIRALTLTGFTPEQSGVLISAGFTLAGITLLWNAFIGPALHARNLLTLALAAVFPGHVYYAALFPIAMCTFFVMLAIKLYDSQRFLWAGVAGAVAAFSYSTGSLLAFVFGLHLLVTRWREGLRSLSAKLLLSAGLTAAGFFAVVLVQRIQVGVWNAYEVIQAKYHYSFTLPWGPLTGQLQSAVAKHDRVAMQGALVFGLVSALVWLALRAPRQPLDTLLAIYALTFWLLPIMLGPGYVAAVRAESMLLPIVPLARKLPLTLLIVLVLLALGLAPQISSLFFTSAIV